MSDLEKYIMEIRDSLNEDDPSGGHTARFRRKLKSRDPKVRRINFRHVLQIAASIAIIAASGVVIVKSSKGSNKMALNQPVEEFREAQQYYAVQVNDRYEDISSMNFNSVEEKQILLEELSGMDTYYKELQKELNANPGDERVMNALIQHYQMKISVMDQIIEQLEQFKNTNNTENEKATI